MKKNFASALFLFWTGILIIAFYVVQKPNTIALRGFADTAVTILVALLLLFNSYGIGRQILKIIKFESDSMDTLLFSFGIGLGALGLLALGFSALQLAKASILNLFQIALGLLFVLVNDVKELSADMRDFAAYWRASFSQYSLFTKIAVLLPAIFSFLLTLTPPFEAFDVLSYHLALPERLLQLGGLRAMDVPPFWYPNVTDYTYLWPLAMRAERSAQMLHFAWAVLAVLLLWRWAVKIWGVEIGRKVLLLIASFVSLPMVASWAYADMALVFYAVGTLYALTKFKGARGDAWLNLIGIMAGFAMSVKYTSFTVPLACGVMLLFARPFNKSFHAAFQFGVIALLIALPWYLRNALVMHNPFYPFLFNGLYWDSFRAEWYANAGTGIGWNLTQILLIPVNMILGHRELSPMDGRIGPLFLILLPFTLWILFTRPRRNLTESWSLNSIGIFFALSFIAWTIGVINSAVLWQVRFLFPALIPLAIPTALGWDYISQLDTSRLRASYLVNVIITSVITLTLLDNAFFVIQRNPLAVALGVQSRERYIERVNPSYAALIQIMDELPPEANIYSLYEPRTYNLPRPTQPDLVLYNFAHDWYLHHNPSEVIQDWKAQGYTHILIYERGADLTLKNDPLRLAELDKTRNVLTLVDQTLDHVYTIYGIP